MSEQPQLPMQAPLEVAQRIHQTCKHFESAWRGADRPQLVTFLAVVSEPERSWLLVELLALEVELRQAAGEQPTEAEYRVIFPREGEWQLIATAFRRCASEAEPSPSSVEDSNTEQRAVQCQDSGAATPVGQMGPDAGSAAIPGKVDIEGYEILDMLGRGGMGVVYKARDLRLKRLVALKMILTGEHAGVEQIARFRTEAEMVARLQHPNIVQIHEVREQRGNPCIVFEYIKGPTLADFAGGEPQTPRVAAELLEAIARAIQYAHEQGIVHRDLKPTNILLASDGSMSGSLNGSTITSELTSTIGQASLVPKIMDFGLAKDLAANLDQTASGTILGTPHYMAPEQAEGRRNIGPASDIYSLGAILYVLLTGRAPIQGTTKIETLHMVINTEPVAPTQLQPRLARDLETICLTCLRKDPARRYSTAGALADDLRRFLNGEPILARPVGRFERAVKWVKRNRAITGAAVAVVLALTAGTTVSYLKYLDAERQWTSAEERRKEAETQTRLAEKQRKEADEERETALAISEFLGGLFEDVDPVARTGRAFGTQRRGEGVLTALEVVDRGALKLKTSLRDKPRVRAALLDRIGTVYLDLERAREAEPLLQEALQIRLTEYGPDSLQVAASRQSIGLLHQCRAEMEPARAAFEQALGLRRKHLGDDHPLVADTLFHLGIQWSSLDNFPGAEECLRESLAIRRRRFGSESREVCGVLFVTGGMYLHFGEDAKAFAPLQEAAALADKLEGKNDFMTVVSLYFQAQLAEKLNAEGARKLYKEAEVKAVKLLGADHHLVALGRSAIAEFLMQQGEFGPAVEILRDVIAVLRKSFGPDSDPVATRLLILARAERGRGHDKEAEAAAAEAIRIRRKSLAGSRPRPLNLAVCLHVQAALVFNRGAHAEAAPLYREGLAILLREKVSSYAERQHTMARDLARLLLEREGLQVSKNFIDHTKASGEPALDLSYAETWAKASQALLRFSQPPTADDQRIWDHFESQAVLMLRSAVAAGLRDADVIRYKEIVAEVEAAGRRAQASRSEAAKLSEAVAEAEQRLRSAAAGAEQIRASQELLALRAKQAEPAGRRLRADAAAIQHATARKQLDLGKTELALAALTEALATREGLAREEPANARYLADAAATLQTLGDLEWRRQRFGPALKQFRRSLGMVAGAVRLDPGDTVIAEQLLEMQRGLAHGYATCGLWDDAAPLHDRVYDWTKPVPINANLWTSSLFLVREGKRAGYRQLTEVMMKRLAPDSNVMEVLRCCTLSPNSAAQPARLSQLAHERRATAGYDEYWLDYNLGAAHYRNGQFKHALSAFARLDPNLFQVLPWLPMVHFRLGDVTKARRLLQDADARYEALLKKALTEGSGRLPVVWFHDLLTFEILRREAGELIEGAAPSTHPYLRAHRGRLYLELGDSDKAQIEFAAARKGRPDDPLIEMAATGQR